MQLKHGDFTFTYDADTLSFEADTGTMKWRAKQSFIPEIELMDDEILRRMDFARASRRTTRYVHTGYADGIMTTFEGFPGGDTLEFSTVWWLDRTSGFLSAQLIPVRESQYRLSRVLWPAPLEFSRTDDACVTVFPLMQGVLIPNGWPQDINLFDRWELEAGLFYTRSAYMPWWGQIDGREGYMALAETPFDGGFDFTHPAGGCTTVGPVWHASLGKLSYTRTLRYTFYNDCDYTLLCKQFRAYLKETGELVTLREKIMKNPNVEKLIGSSVVHTDIYANIHEESFFFDRVEAKDRIRLTSFADRAQQLRNLREKGVERAFVHVDGWITQGYDSAHPDVMPPCPQAGGAPGMRLLADTAHELGYQLATHDQYRDYYYDAPSFDSEQAVVDPYGRIPQNDMWYGGKQAFLCARFAPGYVRRNFELLRDGGIQLDGTYLDVFACVALDECFHPLHPMTRRECMERRRACFDYVRTLGIIVSSEETIGWAMHDLDLVHHAPYAQALKPGGNILLGEVEPESIGIPVPLLNLVYHDCVVIPWFTSSETQEMPNHESGLLHALLNGGISYVGIGADTEEIRTVNTVAALHRRVALDELVRHEFIGGDLKRQKTFFASGVEVTVDFRTGEYSISG